MSVAIISIFSMYLVLRSKSLNPRKVQLLVLKAMRANARFIAGGGPSLHAESKYLQYTSKAIQNVYESISTFLKDEMVQRKLYHHVQYLYSQTFTDTRRYGFKVPTIDVYSDINTRFMHPDPAYMTNGSIGFEYLELSVSSKDISLRHAYPSSPFATPLHCLSSLNDMNTISQIKEERESVCLNNYLLDPVCAKDGT
jgi:hypothetical protein